MIKPHPARRRAFTLIEAVVVILALAISLPTTLVWLDDANVRRADAVHQVRATALATLVMEHVLADVASKSANLGFAALSNSNTYLSTASTGLYARLQTFTAPYTAIGINYTVTIGGLVDKTGSVSGNATFDVFRRVTVSVTFSGGDGTVRTVNLQSMVTAL